MLVYDAEAKEDIGPPVDGRYCESCDDTMCSSAGPSTIKVAYGAKRVLSCKWKLPSSCGKNDPSSISSRNHTSDGFTYTIGHGRCSH